MSEDDAQSETPNRQNDEHPISSAIDTFIHAARDIKIAARQAIPRAIKEHEERRERVRGELRQAIDVLQGEPTAARAVGIRKAEDAIM